MSETSPITTHVLDTARGRPAEGVPVTLEMKEGSAWTNIGSGKTDADGRLKTLLAPGALRKAVYRITFGVEPYFAAHGVQSFYPEASVVFAINDTTQHYHVPLLLAPYGYSTYRGS